MISIPYFILRCYVIQFELDRKHVSKYSVNYFLLQFESTNLIRNVLGTKIVVQLGRPIVWEVYNMFFKLKYD